MTQRQIHKDRSSVKTGAVLFAIGTIVFLKQLNQIIDLFRFITQEAVKMETVNTLEWQDGMLVLLDRPCCLVKSRIGSMPALTRSMMPSAI